MMNSIEDNQVEILLYKDKKEYYLQLRTLISELNKNWIILLFENTSFLDSGKKSKKNMHYRIKLR